MPSNQRPILKEFAPFAPDVKGYCYRDTLHFNKLMEAVAKSLIRQHGLFIDRIPYFVSIVFWLLIGVLLFLSFIRFGVWLYFSLQIVLFVFLFWDALRIKRFIRTIIRNRMCSYCGYSLRHTPTDNTGYAMCSECGESFHLGDYRRLPRDYKRPLCEVDLPDWTDSVHPIERARMYRDASIQSTEDASPQPPPPGV
ncbi:MAG: hypothetical protein IH984_10375 [Planctomycetes bacterium]|nr:hypothetical protein [Planctomycetota bacterium]